jgi:hypothetical protein
MEFERDVPIGPTGLPWPAWLLAHGAVPPVGCVWSRSRRQREVWSRFLPSRWSSFGGALWPAGWHATDRKVVNFPRQVTASPGAISHSPGAIRCRRHPSGWDRISRCGGIAPGRRHIRDRGRRRHGPGNMALESPIPLCRRSAPDSLTDWLLNACGRRKNSGRWGGMVGGRRGPLAERLVMRTLAFTRAARPLLKLLPDFWKDPGFCACQRDQPSI